MFEFRTIYTYIWYNIVILSPEAVSLTLSLSLSHFLSLLSLSLFRIFVTCYDVLIYCGWPKIHNKRPKTITRRVNTLNVYRLFESPPCVLHVPYHWRQKCYTRTLGVCHFKPNLCVRFHIISIRFYSSAVGGREKERER